MPADPDLQLLCSFQIPSARGKERTAIRFVTAVVQNQGLSAAQLAGLQMAVAEAVMNAMEHGNRYRSELPVDVRVLSSAQSLVVRITDRGAGSTASFTEVPDLSAKLSERQPPRGWGTFLIREMVDEVRAVNGEEGHTVELIVHRDAAP